MYRRFLFFAVAAGGALAASNAVAAPERVRGTVASVSGDTLTVDTAVGHTVPVRLTDGTRYLKVAPSSLNHVDPGAYIGTATKSIGDQLIALEVTVFPPSLSAATTVNSMMTNGTVSSAAGSGGAKQIVVTYKGGKQVVFVPPTAPTVTYQLGQKAELKPGAAVIIDAVSHDGMVTANAVAVGEATRVREACSAPAGPAEQEAL
jgi:hypothetical protein